MKWTSGAVLGLVFLFALPQSVQADPIMNGGFESGDFTGWQTIGDALVVDATVGSGPTEGTFQAFLTTASQNGDANNFSGTDAAPAASLEAFLGLPPGSLSPAFEGSAIKQTFMANAGEVLRFDYNFLTTEGQNNDFAFVSLSTLATLADTTSGPFQNSAVVLDPIFGDPTRETGFRSFHYAVPAAGTYTLGIGVADLADEFIPSGLLVDHARLEAMPSQAVPVPPGLMLGCIGAACFTARAIRRWFAACRSWRELVAEKGPAQRER
jgi:hypothetical protein